MFSKHFDWAPKRRKVYMECVRSSDYGERRMSAVEHDLKVLGVGFSGLVATVTCVVDQRIRQTERCLMIEFLLTL